jgi:hypothetical protein
MNISPEMNAWNTCSLEDLWIFDKLIVAKKAGHLCGPRGIPVPKPGKYFVKPVTNIEGMGEKARVEYLEEDTCHLHPGEFWCEIFTGDHISIDYNGYNPVLSVIGTKHEKHPHTRFTHWKKTEQVYKLPSFIGLMPLRYKTINCEFIGGNLIEIHLRENPDFAYGNSEIIPVWKDESKDSPETLFANTRLIRDGYRFISDDGQEMDRLGIWVK